MIIHEAPSEDPVRDHPAPEYNQRITPMQSDSLMDFLPGIYQTLIRLTILCIASSEWPLASALLRLSLNTNNNNNLFSLYIYIYIYIFTYTFSVITLCRETP